MAENRQTWSRLRSASLIGVGALLGAALFPALGSAPARAAGATTITYSTPGEHEFTVPAGVTSVGVVAIGATGGAGTGGGGAGGDGAKVTGSVAVTPGEQLFAEVAVGGGAGASTTVPVGNVMVTVAGGDGGGETDLRTCRAAICALTATDSRVLVAGGGGGGAPGLGNIAGIRTAGKVPSVTFTPAFGGTAGFPPATACDADGFPGQDGQHGSGGGSAAAQQGKGGTCTAGGAGGSSGGVGVDGSPGTVGAGGNGGDNSATLSAGVGAGGGAGIFGGGGGDGVGSEGFFENGAGGGGSSCAPCAHTTSTNAVTNPSVGAAGGVSAALTLTDVVVVAPTVPSTGAGLEPWKAALALGGVLLAGLAIAGRRPEDIS
jgi:hypothetical protein